MSISTKEHTLIGYRRGNRGSFRPKVCRKSNSSTESLQLELGGRLVVKPGYIQPDVTYNVTRELLCSGQFLTHDVQNVEEPRVHFLLHENAVENEARGPGYQYHQVRLKATSFRRFPCTERLSGAMESICQHLDRRYQSALPQYLTRSTRRTFWNVGVHATLYRDGNDHLGWHTDETHSETIICTAIVHSVVPRILRIRPKKKADRADKTWYELILQNGDVYYMDREMQQHYQHSLVKVRSEEDAPRAQRLVLIFRRGQERNVGANGSPGKLIRAPKPLAHYGSIRDLPVGAIHTRRELMKINAIRSAQGGVSGNKETGCDAIITSGKDAITKSLLSNVSASFEYSCRTSYSKSLRMSQCKRQPIRVFRKRSARKPHPMYVFEGLFFVIEEIGKVLLDQDKEFVVFRLHRLDYEPALHRILVAEVRLNTYSLTTSLWYDLVRNLADKYTYIKQRTCTTSFPRKRVLGQSSPHLLSAFVDELMSGCHTKGEAHEPEVTSPSSGMQKREFRQSGDDLPALLHAFVERVMTLCNTEVRGSIPVIEKVCIPEIISLTSGKRELEQSADGLRDSLYAVVERLASFCQTGIDMCTAEITSLARGMKSSVCLQAELSLWEPQQSKVCARSTLKRSPDILDSVFAPKGKKIRKDSLVTLRFIILSKSYLLLLARWGECSRLVFI